MEYFNAFKMVALAAVGILAVSLGCFYLFRATNVISYRLVAIFLSLIFLSNLISRLLIEYYDGKR